MEDVRLVQEVYLLLAELVALDHAQNITLQDLDIDSLIDGCLGAIHVLLRDESQRRLLLELGQHSVINTLISFTRRPNLNFQREATGALCELVHVRKNYLRHIFPTVGQIYTPAINFFSLNAGIYVRKYF